MREKQLIIEQELIELSLKHCLQEGLHNTALTSLKIVRSNRITERIHNVYTPCVCFIVQGEKALFIGNNIYHYSSSQYLVTSIDLPLAGQITMASNEHPYLCLVLAIEPQLVYEIIHTLNTIDTTPHSSDKGFFLNEVKLDLSDAFLRLMYTLNCPNDRLILAPAIIREILYRLLNASHGNVIRQLGLSDSQTKRISKAIELIRKNYATAFNIKELADIASMSPSSFHQHFKRVTTMSPLQYQKHIRLQEARYLLSTQGIDAASAAFQVGYESASQFSREYTRMFGLPPMKDVKKRYE